MSGYTASTSIEDVLSRVRRLDSHEKELEKNSPASNFNKRLCHGFEATKINLSSTKFVILNRFVQAVEEVAESLKPVFEADPKLVPIFQRLLEPERVISFRVAWLDDTGAEQVNRGWRVQYNSAIGPYKGGLRFHPSVNQGVIKFLGFEQIFKNSLTTLPMGGGKGGSDFDPKGKSDAEVQRFCQSFMQELARHIGPDTDVPAGDIGVGGREIGFMFGMLKKLHARYEAGSLTGKGIEFGGSLVRPEATGYGTVYFCQEMLQDLRARSMKGLRCAVSGSGNVSQYCLEKLLQLEAVPLTVSDSNGTLYFEDGLTREDLDLIMELKNVRRDRLSALAESDWKGRKVSYHAGQKPWQVVNNLDVAFPCATQNEINKAEAQMLVDENFRKQIEMRF